jgi:mono/diheme cytochrome c family protein
MIKYIIILLGVLLTTNVYAGNYVYSYGNQVNHVDILEKRIQIDPNYFLGLDGLYAVGESINEEKHAEQQSDLDKLRAENAKMQAQLDLLIKLLTKGQPLPGGTEVEPTPEPEPEPPAKEPTLDDHVYQLFKTKCYTCHKNDSNGIALFNKDGTALSDGLTLNDVVNVHHRTEGIVLADGETMMPKGGKPFTSDEMKLMKKWMFEFSRR